MTECMTVETHSNFVIFLLNFRERIKSRRFIFMSFSEGKKLMVEFDLIELEIIKKPIVFNCTLVSLHQQQELYV